MRNEDEAYISGWSLPIEERAINIESLEQYCHNALPWDHVRMGIVRLNLVALFATREFLIAARNRHRSTRLTIEHRIIV